MSANQRKNKNKKKKNAAKEESVDCQSTGSAIIHHVDHPTTFQSSLEGEVLFQGRKGSVANSHKVYLCAGDIRALGFQPGAFAHLHINPDPYPEEATGSTVTVADVDNGTHVHGSKVIISQVWPSSELMKNAVSLTRFWQPSFPDDTRRDVVVSKLSPRFAVHQCTAATFSILSASSAFDFEELVASSAFRRYFAAALCETMLCIDNSFVLSWRGELITAKVNY
jgi:hypothetical protein